MSSSSALWPRACVVLEATGVYHLDLALALHRARGIDVMVVNPRAARDFAKTIMRRAKTDAVLSRGSHSSLIDTRLYLPREWTEDPARCREAKVPEKEIVDRTKPELALEMIRHARAQGLGFHWVGADGLYGQDGWFLRALDDREESFVVDVHKDQRVYLEDPAPFIRLRRSARGRRPHRRVTATKNLRVDEWARRQPRSSWKRMRVRESTKGTLRLEVLHRRVWLWDGKEERPRLWHLIVSREIGSREKTKYGLSNLPADTPIRQIARMQRQRYWIERSFQDSKSESGLGDYQARGWVAWHHHMALVMMAMQFMLEERLRQKEEHPLLSCANIEVLLAHFLPRRDVTEEEDSSDASPLSTAPGRDRLRLPGSEKEEAISNQ